MIFFLNSQKWLLCLQIKIYFENFIFKKIMILKKTMFSFVLCNLKYSFNPKSWEEYWM